MQQSLLKASSCEYVRLIEALVKALGEYTSSADLAFKRLAYDIVDVVSEQGFTYISPLRDYTDGSSTLYHWSEVRNLMSIKGKDPISDGIVLKSAFLKGVLNRTRQADIIRYLPDEHYVFDVSCVDPGMAVLRTAATCPYQTWDLAILMASHLPESLNPIYTYINMRGVDVYTDLVRVLPNALDTYLARTNDTPDVVCSTVIAALSASYFKLMMPKFSLTTSPNKVATLNALQALCNFFSSEAFRA